LFLRCIAVHLPLSLEALICRWAVIGGERKYSGDKKPSDLLMTMISNGSLLKPGLDEMDAEGLKCNARGLDMLIFPRPASSPEEFMAASLKNL
jgi:hypothetical protein